MSEFEFTFSLFGLLLGFSLVEVLSGLVRTMKLRGKVRIGWLTPLLGLFVMVDLTSFWSIAWQMREAVPANFAVLLLGLLICGVYYFSASMVFPDEPDEWPDFDAWADKHKRQVMLGIAVANLIATAAVLSRVPAELIVNYALINSGLFAAMAAAGLIRQRWATGVLLVGILGFYFWFSLLPLLR